jgi:hypothetical protein
MGATILTGREHRPELAGGEVFQGAEASVEFGGRQAATSSAFPGTPRSIRHFRTVHFLSLSSRTRSRTGTR